jgi:GTP-binding protein
MLVDSIKVLVKAGDGGRGCSSFYRDKYTRHGIPNGGDGGRGASIIVRCDRNQRTLLDFQFHRHFIAKSGEHGTSNNKKGKDAKDIVIRVPLGTTIKDVGSDCVLRVLDKDEDEVVVAKGGAGGLGNKKKKDATCGECGEEKELLFDLRLIADVGIVGFPNAGKSTLISALTNANPKIAAYPFTTKSPILGIAHAKNKDFSIADIPGLIKGSSEGRGLGDRFLRHVERTKLLIHLIDMAGFEGRDPLDDYRVINKELKDYSKALFRKSQIIAANKMDLEGAKKNLNRFKRVIKKKIFPISALKKKGLSDLIEAIAGKL